MSSAQYNEEIADEVLFAVSTSHLSLPELCEKNPHWPTDKYIYKWRIEREDFGSRYARAKQLQIETLVERALQLTRDSDNDFYDAGNGRSATNMAYINRIRMEIDTIKWFAAKLAPKIYGENKKDDKQNQDSLIEKLIDKL